MHFKPRTRNAKLEKLARAKRCAVLVHQAVVDARRAFVCEALVLVLKNAAILFNNLLMSCAHCAISVTNQHVRNESSLAYGTGGPIATSH